MRKDGDYFSKSGYLSQQLKQLHEEVDQQDSDYRGTPKVQSGDIIMCHFVASLFELIYLHFHCSCSR